MVDALYKFSIVMTRAFQIKEGFCSGNSMSFPINGARIRGLFILLWHLGRCTR